MTTANSIRSENQGAIASVDNETTNRHDDNHTTVNPSDSDANVAAQLLHPTIVQDMIPYIALCIAILHGIYLYFYNSYANYDTMLFGALRIPSPDDCVALQQLPQPRQNETAEPTHNEKCGRPDLFAFQMVSGLVFLVVSLFGLHAWYHIHRHPQLRGGEARRTTLPASRLYGYRYEAHVILLINLSYQIWDFIISIAVIAEHGTTIMLLHHAVAALVAYCGLYNYMFSYYAIFFLGLSEVSSIFLVSLDLHQYFIPPTAVIRGVVAPVSTTPQQHIPLVLSNVFFVYSQHIAGPLFVMTFIYYRIVLWYTVSRRLWDDVHFVTTAAADTGGRTTTISNTKNTQPQTTTTTTETTQTTISIAEQLRPRRTYILYIWLYANLPMGVLQLYFLSIIVDEIQQKFFR